MMKKMYCKVKELRRDCAKEEFAQPMRRFVMWLRTLAGVHSPDEFKYIWDRSGGRGGYLLQGQGHGHFSSLCDQHRLSVQHWHDLCS